MLSLEKEILIEQYNLLSEKEKFTLHTLCFYGRPITRAKLYEFSTQSNWKIKTNRSATKNALKTLLDLNIVIEDSSKNIAVYPHFIDHILKEYYKIDSFQFKKLGQDIKNYDSTFYSGPYYQFEYERELRIILFSQNVDEFEALIERSAENVHDYFPPYLLEMLLKGELDNLLERTQIHIPYLCSVYSDQLLSNLLPFPLLEDFPTFVQRYLTNSSVDLTIFCGKSFKLSQHVIDSKNLTAINYLLSGEKDLAQKQFSEQMQIFQKQNNTRKKYLPGLQGVFYTMSLMASYPQTLTLLKPLISNGAKEGFNPLIQEIYKALKIIVAQSERQSSYISVQELIENPKPIISFFSIMAQYLMKADPLKSFQETIIALYKKAQTNKYHYIETELAYICNQLFDDSTFETINNTTCAISSHYKEPQQWEIALNALSEIQEEKSEKPVQQYRLIWLLDMEYQDVTAIEQKMLKNGTWNKGKQISPKKLKNTPPHYIGPRDEKIIDVIYDGDRYGSVYFTHIPFEKAFSRMVEHPLIFHMRNPSQQIHITRKNPELIITKDQRNYTLEIPNKLYSKSMVIIKEDENRYAIMELTSQQEKICRAMGGPKVKIPLEAKKEVNKVIQNLSTLIEINTDFVQENIPFVEPDSKPYILLTPSHTGFMAHMVVIPLQSLPKKFTPGIGRPNIMGVVDNKKIQTRREIALETQEANNIIGACPSLESWDDFSEEFFVGDPIDCLELLSQLKKIGVRVQWPQGEKIKLHKNSISAQNLSLRIKKQNNWFALSGDIQVDENMVINLKKMVEMITQSSSRFITLDDQQYVEISKSLKKQMLQLQAVAYEEQQQFLLHPLATQAVEPLTQHAQSLTADDKWQKHIQQLEQMRTFSTKTPSTLKAQLRPYQEEGFQWLARLSQWGVGACLADDMGLGKTIQAIAMLLYRAKNGPSLVVAPASVCSNWIKELQRFAPSLTPILLNGAANGDPIANAAPFHVIITSYGILSSRCETLSQKTWNTLVLDEAHAIKNTNTKRYKAAIELQADIRIITTGTPIQNHLGELWSLFNFINKGFLGTFKKFEQKYLIATTHAQEMQKQKHLKQLVLPFMLRRTKSQVLDDLPQKTEITLEVEMTDQEKALYEALRQQALENIDSSDKENGSTKQMQILAGITRLRQLCCHPRLAISESPLQSSKMELFMNTLRELHQNNHRVLVFSQFTSFLKLVKEQVEQEGYSYQYLDGTTPLKKRDRSVNDFQNGEGDLFLISLKAGGLGLNLTAADFVIHLDPWWNPAIEDQASDRAHRIGQTRPVTIYRLITRGTIEEKIVKLHHQKRELTDSILHGAHKSSKLSTAEMLKILMER